MLEFAITVLQLLTTGQTSSLQILLSLQKHLSTALTTYSIEPSTSKAQPQFHNNHFRKIVLALLTCPPSPRSSHPSSSKKQKSDELGEGSLKEDVSDAFLNTWLDVHDDIRWFFLREAGWVLMLYLILSTAYPP